MYNVVKCLHRTHCGFYVFITTETNFYAHIDKILKTHNDFQNISINVVFLLNIFYLIRKTLFSICATLVGDFICLYMWKQIFMYRYEKVHIIKF